MTPSIEFFFDFISPYGWFAAERVGGLARRHDRAVIWQPLLLKATVVETMGLPPLLETPLKGKYLLHDAARSARFYDLPWHPPASMSFSSVPRSAPSFGRPTTPAGIRSRLCSRYIDAPGPMAAISPP